MTIPAGFPYPLNQVVEIPLEHIIPNPKQPRRSMRQESLGTLAASMKAKGQLTEAKVRPLTEAERVSRPGVWVMLVGGHRRREAALLNGFKTLKCIVDDIAPEDTHYQALMDNDHEEMDWWDWDLAIEEESKTFQGTLEELGARLNKGMTKIYGALKIGKAFNPAARALVDENLEKSLKNDLRSPKSKNKGFFITETTLLVLADLEDPGRVLNGLQAVMDDYLTTDQTQKLVEHMQSGNPIGTFNPHAKGSINKPLAQSTRAPQLEASEQMSATHANAHKALAQPNHVARHEASQQGPHPHPAQLPPSGGVTSPTPAQTPTAPPEEPSDNWFWKMMVGIKFFNQLRSKVKKGEPLTGWEKCFVWGHAGIKGLGKFLKFLKKLFEPLAKSIGHAAKKALGDTLSGLLVLFFRIALICLLVWAVIKVIDYGFVYPWHWVEHKVESIFHHEDITAPTPSANGNNNGPLAQSNPVLPKVEVAAAHFVPAKKKENSAPASAPVITYQPAVSFAPPASPSQSLYDPKILEIEVAAIPRGSIVKDYPFTPDETMPGDLAVSRLQDLTDTDRYTMKIGGGTEKILSLSPTATNLILNYKSSDALGGFVDGSGQLNFFWEDVKYIHINEMDVETQTPLVIYQCSLIVSGSKNPLTIQCARPEDLEHLVSTLEYFIRSSRLGHDAQPAGLPYTFQGLRLTNDGVVDKLWADSPMDKAGVSLGDHFWSIGKVAFQKQSRSDLEAGLKTLPVTFYCASDAEWNRALHDRNPSQANSFRPRLRKVILTAP